MVRALTEDIADLQQMGEWFYSLPLLYYDAEQQRYCLCALLRKFLLYRLHNASFLTQWDSYHRCGCWYREHGGDEKKPLPPSTRFWIMREFFPAI